MIAYLLGNSALSFCSVSKDILKGLHIPKVVSSTFGVLVNQIDKIKTIKRKMIKSSYCLALSWVWPGQG